MVKTPPAIFAIWPRAAIARWRSCARPECGRSHSSSPRRWDRFLLAGRYTLLEQEALHAFLPQCLDHGARVLLGGVFNSGILASGTSGPGPHYYNYAPAPPDVIARVARIEAVCAAHGISLAAAALAFPQAHPAVAAVLPGLASAAEVASALALAATPIPPALWADLVAQGLLDPAAPVPVPVVAGEPGVPS